MNINEIFNNNKSWIQKKLLKNKNYFKELSQDQHPKIFYLGCSDSRVTAEELMGAEPGEIFVHRNIANLMANQDISSQSVLQFAVEILKVEHIILCGHYECGGIRASFETELNPTLKKWLFPLKQLQVLHQEKIHSLSTRQEQEDYLVELSIQYQCQKLSELNFIQQSRLKSNFPKIHGWIFNIRNGELIDLKIDS